LTASYFVAREREIQHLRDVLGRSLAGKGQICFVTGEAGAGKTTLTENFAQKAQQEQADLLVAVGNCNAQTGIGDPYLPFREILGQLTGDVEDKLTQGAISEENANRLQGFLSISGRAIADLGPDLIDIFLPGAGLLARASHLVASDSGLSKRLNRLRRNQVDRSERDLPVQGQLRDAQQNRIFEQFTSVLVALADQKPLVILLDDLQWADESSAALLFHLARRIKDSRILVLGTYRPEDVALGRGDQRHPLESVVNEIKRLHGEVILPTGSLSDGDGLAFIDAVLDTRPNRLSKSFRQKLLDRTHGQALFTTELLNGMINRGDLVADAEGNIVEGPELDWDNLPARVEGVIEERIARIPENLQELLAVASVEGEVFIGQVAARLLQMEERRALQALNRELGQVHNLVREDGTTRIGRQRLTRFRFRHSLIQRYLYNRLGTSERELLHEDIAQILEDIYGASTEEVAGRLARHYELAQLPERAAGHYLETGLRAMRLFATGEAATLISRGLGLLASLPETGQTDELRVELQLALGRIQWKRGLAPEAMQTFQSAAETAERIGSSEQLARAALGYDDPRFRFNFPVEPAVELLEKALAGLESGDSKLRVRVVCALVRAQGHEMNELILTTLVDQALAMARRLGDPLTMYNALRAQALSLGQPGRIKERLSAHSEMVRQASRLRDKAPLLDAYLLRIDDLLALGDIDAMDADLEDMGRIADEIGEPFYDYCHRTKLAMRALLGGRFEEAERLAQDSMDCSQQMDVDNAEGIYGMQMFSIRRLQGGLEGLAPVIAHFVATHSQASSWRPGLALIYSEMDDRAAARESFEQLAEDDFSIIPKDSLYLTCLSYLGDVCAYLGDKDRAPVLYEMLLPYAEQAVVVGNSITCNGAASRILGRLAAVLQKWEAAEAHFEHAIGLNARLTALPWLAHTQDQYAQMLLQRNRDEDVKRAQALRAAALETASSLGMAALERSLRDEHAQSQPGR
jgi:tetratricopeptide (TPR) repeat protein